MSKNVKDLLTATAYDNNGDKVGDVNEVFVDDDSGQPTFVDVNHGLFGMGNSMVPLRGHSVEGNNLNLAFSKDKIKDAPEFDADKPLTPEEQTKIYEHYGISDASHVEGYTGGERPGQQARDNEHARTTTDADTRGATDNRAAAGAGAAGAGAAGAGVAGAGAAGAGTAGARDDRNDRDIRDDRDVRRESQVTEPRHADTTADDARTAGATGGAGTTNTNNDNTLVRNEEHLNVGTERVQTGEARLRKYVVTDTETVEVPVSREEVRVERQPISAEDAEAQAKSGGLESEDGTTGEASVTLHEERPVVDKETVPVEKVNLSTEKVSDTERVTEDVRKEQIEADGVEGFNDKK